LHGPFRISQTFFRKFQTLLGFSGAMFLPLRALLKNRAKSCFVSPVSEDKN